MRIILYGMVSSVLENVHSWPKILVFHSEDCIWKWNYFNIRHRNTFTIYEAENWKKEDNDWKECENDITVRSSSSIPILHFTVQMKIENSNSFILCVCVCALAL